jgi:hypothetical protein
VATQASEKMLPGVNMAEGILGSRVRLHDARVGELVLIKYAGSSTGKRPIYLVKFSSDPTDSTFCRDEDFVFLSDAEPES